MISLATQCALACPSFENRFAPVAAGAEARVGAGVAGAAGAGATAKHTTATNAALMAVPQSILLRADEVIE